MFPICGLTNDVAGPIRPTRQAVLAVALCSAMLEMQAVLVIAFGVAQMILVCDLMPM